MIFRGEFKNKQIEIFTYKFDVYNKKSIHCRLENGKFEHVFVCIKDSSSKIRGLFTFKTRVKDYYIGEYEDECSNNTIPGPIEYGTWEIEVIKTYDIYGEFEIIIDFETIIKDDEARKIPMLQNNPDKIYEDREGWYRGDFHCHSHYSDGRVSFNEIMKDVEKKKLDYISITDHSTVTTKFPENDFLTLKSTEITWGNMGHYNAHGLDEFIDYKYYIDKFQNRNESLDAIFKDLKSKGCVIGLNHPFTMNEPILDDFDIRNFNVIEVINAPHLFHKKIDNEKAIRFFDYLWNHGIYLWGIGGSDAHKKNYFDTYPLGIPVTNVYCKKLTQRNLINSVKKGYIFINTCNRFEVEYTYNSKKILPGERVNGTVNIMARAYEPCTWQLIKNGDVIDEQNGKSYIKKICINKNEYFRLQAKEDGKTVLFVNPIHDMHNKSNLYRIQDLLKDFMKGEY